MDLTLRIVGDKSPKATHKQAAQKQLKEDAAKHLVTDRVTGRSRGFAFVTMSSGAEGKAAIGALEGKKLDGRYLRVNEARPKEEGGRRTFSRSRW